MPSDHSHQCIFEAGKYVLHSAGLSQNKHFLAKKAKVGTLTFWQKGKRLGHPTPDTA
jgi:hypothetical protein